MDQDRTRHRFPRWALLVPLASLTGIVLIGIGAFRVYPGWVCAPPPLEVCSASPWWTVEILVGVGLAVVPPAAVALYVRHHLNRRRREAGEAGWGGREPPERSEGRRVRL